MTPPRSATGRNGLTPANRLFDADEGDHRHEQGASRQRDDEVQVRGDLGHWGISVLVPSLVGVRTQGSFDFDQNHFDAGLTDYA